MQRTSTRKRIDALLKERKDIKTSISQLKEKLSKKHGNLSLPPTRRKNLESRATHSAPVRTENSSFLKKRLKISEWINKVVYTNEVINLLENGSNQYTADAVTGSVTFQIHFIVEEMENKEINVHSLKVAYLDHFHESELKTFSNRYARENNIQKLIRGIVSYADWFSNREEITDWLSEENESHFSVTKLHEDGAYNVTAKARGRSSSYFSCEWKIVWNEGSLAMNPSFTVRANNKGHFYKENVHLFNKIVSHGITLEDITETWKKLAEAVILENEFERAEENG